MITDHSARGQLQSGATIKEALRFFEEQSSRVLARTLNEAGKLVEHRGLKWRAAMDGIEEALTAHLENAHAYLQPTINLADRHTTSSVSSAVDERLANTGARLRAQLEEFREGWTAPVPKMWKDRHPFWYALMLIVIGALIGAVLRSLAEG